MKNKSKNNYQKLNFIFNGNNNEQVHKNIRTNKAPKIVILIILLLLLIIINIIFSTNIKIINKTSNININITSNITKNLSFNDISESTFNLTSSNLESHPKKAIIPNITTKKEKKNENKTHKSNKKRIGVVGL